MIRKVEMERFTLISAWPFDEVVAAIKTSIGNPNMAEFWKSTQAAKSADELDAVVQRVLGKTGLMLFVEFDHGMIVRKGTERHTSDPNLSRFAGRVSDSGEGRWTIKAAIDEAVPAPVLTAALYERFSSRGEADFANKLLSAMRYEFGGHVKSDGKSKVA
jgi:6-phosphogluconate dehydrogenase